MDVEDPKPSVEFKATDQDYKYIGKDPRTMRYNFIHDRTDRPEVIRTDVDFKKTDLPEYDGLYATILDNCFTEAECNALVSMAEAQTNGSWEPAMINVGGNRQELMLYSRDCGRIIWDDEELVANIWSRVKDFVPEITSLTNVPKVTGNWPALKKETWEMSRLNERMRFLKYSKGQYFRPHCDGHYETPHGDERSYFTLHLYLNDSVDGNIGGGATTFHSMNMKRQYDVAPKTGRVLLFQQRGLLHSGADVTSGTKFTLRTDLMYKKPSK
ncbi:hypothetical protein ACLMJK_000516 [Lecanora helva]